MIAPRFCLCGPQFAMEGVDTHQTQNALCTATIGQPAMARIRAKMRYGLRRRFWQVRRFTPPWTTPLFKQSSSRPSVRTPATETSPKRDRVKWPVSIWAVRNPRTARGRRTRPLSVPGIRCRRESATPVRGDQSPICRNEKARTLEPAAGLMEVATPQGEGSCRCGRLSGHEVRARKSYREHEWPTCRKFT